MRSSFLFTSIFLILSISCCGQIWNDSPVCGTDTLAFYPNEKYAGDSLVNNPKRYLECKEPTKFGIRLEIGVANYRFTSETLNWLGNHGSPSFSISGAYGNFTLGFRYKPWVMDAKNMQFIGIYDLPSDAKLAPVKLDYYLGYSINLPWITSVEPYIGWNQSIFKLKEVGDQPEYDQIKNTGGFIVGTTLNKYFELKSNRYLAIYASCGYDFIDYKSINEGLSNGNFEWTYGIAYKGFLNKKSKHYVD